MNKEEARKNRQEAMQRHANYYFSLMFNNGLHSDGDKRNARLAYARVKNGKVTSVYNELKLKNALVFYGVI